MELLKQNFEICPTLLPIEQDIIIARDQSKRISECTESEISKHLYGCILKCYQDCGQLSNDRDILIQVTDLTGDLQKYFGTVFLNELNIFFKQGIDGLHGEYFGLNCKTYRQWLRGGMGHITRLNALKTQQKFLEERNKPKELTAQEKELKMKAGVLELFEEFKKTKFVYDAANVTYNWLDKQGHIKFTIQRKKEMIKQAGIIVRSGITDKIQMALSSIERQKLKADMDGLTETDIRIKSEAKRIALNTFFKELVETGTELTDLL